MAEVKKSAAASSTKKASTAPKSAPKATAATKSPVSAADRVTKNKNMVYATGKRKNSVARVYLAPGKGNIIVNSVPMNEYFKRPVLQMILNQPFDIVNRVGQYDVMAFVSGGGLSGQAGAVKHGISKAITLAEADARSVLKKAGFLTRDSRVVERKHYGKRKARRSTQFSKR